MYPISTALGILLALSNFGTSFPAEINPNTSDNHNVITAQSPLLLPPIFPTILPQSKLETKRQTIDNTCGYIHGGKLKCDGKQQGDGLCCSRWGFCGNGPLYCGDGCQKAFGKCGSDVRRTKCGPKNKNKSCSLDDCCSANGKCGQSEAFCGKHCQPAFGKCHSIASLKSEAPSNPTSTSEKKPRPETKPKAHPGRCGKYFENEKCEEGLCCSAAGFCGKGEEFCAVPQNCQTAFGICDSDEVPKGLDLSPASQPRPQVGNVPYGSRITRCTKRKTVALSFDDGPSNNTGRILDILRAHNAHATFFLSGNTQGRGNIDQVDTWIDVVKRIIVEGHQIGSHSWSHPHMNMTSRDTHISDMVRNDRALANIVGKFPTYMRPPYLECSSTSGCLKDMADIGYHVVGMEVDTNDWQEQTKLYQMQFVIDEVLKNKKTKDNMLLIQHDSNQYAAELTEYVLEQTHKKHWRAVTLGECLEDPEEFWYNDPVWIDPNTVARSKGANGCIVSATGFCGQLEPFQNHSECRRSVDWCMKATETCLANTTTPGSACEKWYQVCLRHTEFCSTCETKGNPACRSSEWIFNRFGH